MKKLSSFLRGCIAVGLLVFAGSASATLIGSTVNMSAYYPDTSRVYNNPGNVVVAEGVEYAAGSYAGYSSSWQIDISANQLMVTDIQTNGFPFGGATFNGWILDVIWSEHPLRNCRRVEWFLTICHFRNRWRPSFKLPGGSGAHRCNICY